MSFLVDVDGFKFLKLGHLQLRESFSMFIMSVVGSGLLDFRISVRLGIVPGPFEGALPTP